MTKTELPNLYDVPPARLEATVGDIVTPAFRIKQIADWLYRRGAHTFEEMTNLPRETREQLAQRFTLAFPKVIERTTPAADDSQKYLLSLADGNRIEAVYMPMADRTSVCLSTQAGCAVGCTFCVTGFFGAGRNLAPSEMIGQLFTIREEKAAPPEMLNVVFMGMGEPLLNFDNLVATLDVFYKTIAPKRITVSTAGIIPGIEDLAKLERRPNLAVSINAPDRKRREEIMPITAKYPLDDLIATLRRFPVEKNRDLTAEYVLLAGYNDSVEDAQQLARLLQGLQIKVNAIPFNEDANLPEWMKRPNEAAIDRFVDALVRRNIRVTVRRSKGRDIAAACGQLRGKSEAKSRATGGHVVADRTRG